MVLMAVGLTLAAGCVWLGPASVAVPPGGLRPNDWLLLWSLLSASLLVRAAGALVVPVPQRVQLAVGNAIMSIITLDAALVLATCGPRWAVVVLALLPLFLAGRRLVPPT
jgi:hypothetical protein